MRKRFTKVIGLGTFLLAAFAMASPAASKADAKVHSKQQGTKRQEAPSLAPATTGATASGQPADLSSNLSALFGSGFHNLACSEFISTPDGQVEIRSGAKGDGSFQPVIVVTDQLHLECGNLRVDPKTNVMTATGAPVKIQQNGINAECNKYVYDMTKKESTLSQNPVVLQKSGDKITRWTSDLFILTQDPTGRVGIHMKMDENHPNSVTQIVVLPSDDKTTSATKTAARPQAQKIEGSQGPALIKMPGM